MAYGKIKTWIAAEVLTASDLNAEFSNNVTNENDLGTKLTAEVAARSGLESQYDTFHATVWNSGSSQIQDNVVALGSMKDNSVDNAELVDLCVTHDKVAAANKDGIVSTPSMRTLGTGALQAAPGDGAIPLDNSVTVAKLKDTVAGTHTVTTAQTVEYCHNGTSYTKVTEVKLAISGAVRVKFHLRRYDTDGIAYGRIYKNGVGFGTSRSNTSSAGVWYEEDLSGFIAGDLLQLYTKQSSSSGQVCVKDLSLSITVPIKDIVTLESS